MLKYYIMEGGIVRFVPKGIINYCISFNNANLGYLVFNLLEGAKKSFQDLEDFKVQIQRFDGATIRIPTDFTYVDISIPEGNFNLIR